MRRLGGRVPIVILVLALVTLLTGCLVPPVPPLAATNPGYDVPDPAMVPEAFYPALWTQVYGTNSCGSVECPSGTNPTIHIPTYSIAYPPAGDSSQRVSNALPSYPAGTSVYSSWSPTVMYIDGRFLMYYTARYKEHDSCELPPLNRTPHQP
jgi:hypothetical protein